MIKINILALSLFISISTPAFALDWIEGRVINVTDGDGITLEDAKGDEYEIRLFAIDAPETSCHFKSAYPKQCIEQAQPSGLDSKNNLSRLVLNKLVSVKLGFGTSYSRAVGIVYLNGEDINLRQIMDGYAWHETNFAHRQTRQERKTYSTAEELARYRQIGLWTQENPESPWAYRRRLRDKRHSLRSSW